MSHEKGTFLTREPTLDHHAFMRNIAEDPTDQLRRDIYADWLEEQGDDDEGLRQREWNASREWMESWASGVNIAYTDVIEAGMSVFSPGVYGWDYHVQYGEDVAQSQMYHDRPEWWRHWQIITGLRVNLKQQEFTVFSCSC